MIATASPVYSAKPARTAYPNPGGKGDRRQRTFGHRFDSSTDSIAGPVPRGVVNHDDLVVDLVALEFERGSLDRLRDRVDLVVSRDHDRQLHDTGCQSSAFCV